MAPLIHLGLWWCHAIVLVSTVSAVGAVVTFGWHALDLALCHLISSDMHGPTRSCLYATPHTALTYFRA